MESKKFILESLKYIEDNLEEQLSLQNISSHMGYSEYHFSRLFKSIQGIAVMDYVKKRKLIKASSDILNGNKIIDTAFHYGWQTHGGFTKAFKQEFGFSPALLRAMIMQIDYLGGNAMNHVFMNKTNEHATKEQLFQVLKEEISREGISVDPEKLDQVYDFACLSYQNRKRYSGDDYVTHPLNVAILLVQMGADENTIFAGLLCDVLSKTDMVEEIISNNVSIEVKNKLKELNNFHVNQLQLETNEDIIMIKLAERLHNMRTVEFMDEEIKAVKAKETIELFIPIARKLGNDKLVEELNDLSLKYVTSLQ